MEDVRRRGVRFVALGEPEYPPALRAIDLPPPLIPAARPRGRPASADGGDRRLAQCLCFGATFTERLARELGAAGHVIVSGLARGIDQRAHHASLETGTVAVLAGGHDQILSGRTAALLMARILEHGAAVSEMPMEWEPRGRDFPRRNRIVAGLALGRPWSSKRRAARVRSSPRVSPPNKAARFSPCRVRRSTRGPREPTVSCARARRLCTRRRRRADRARAVAGARSVSILREEPADAGEPLWGEPALVDVDPHSSPRRGPATNSIPVRPTRHAGDQSQGACAILALLGPSPISLDELARAAEAPARLCGWRCWNSNWQARRNIRADRVACLTIAQERD